MDGQKEKVRITDGDGTLFCGSGEERREGGCGKTEQGTENRTGNKSGRGIGKSTSQKSEGKGQRMMCAGLLPCPHEHRANRHDRFEQGTPTPPAENLNDERGDLGAGDSRRIQIASGGDGPIGCERLVLIDQIEPASVDHEHPAEQWILGGAVHFERRGIALLPENKFHLTRGVDEFFDLLPLACIERGRIEWHLHRLPSGQARRQIGSRGSRE